MFADLHIHTRSSDGSASCQEILEQAVRHRVDVIAVTDHNTTAAYPTLRRLLPSYPTVSVIPGVELDAKLEGRRYHILGLGIDESAAAVQEVCTHNAEIQEQYNQALLSALCRDYPALSLTEYLDFVPRTDAGGWKLLHYLLEKGVTRRLREGIGFAGDYGFDYDAAAFPSVSAISSAILAGGGIPVLAHPIDIPFPPLSQPFRELLSLHRKSGVKGIECIHPQHSSAMEKALLEFCAEHGLYASGGTDFHGEFFGGQKQKIGGQFVREEQVANLLRDTARL